MFDPHFVNKEQGPQNQFFSYTQHLRSSFSTEINKILQMADHCQVMNSATQSHPWTYALAIFIYSCLLLLQSRGVVLKDCSAARPTTAVFWAGRCAMVVMIVVTTPTKTQASVQNAIQLVI